MPRSFQPRPNLVSNYESYEQQKSLPMSRTSWTPSVLRQAPVLSTNQRYGSYGQQPQLVRSFPRVFQPEPSRNLNTDLTGSGYRR